MESHKIQEYKTPGLEVVPTEVYSGLEYDHHATAPTPYYNQSKPEAHNYPEVYTQPAPKRNICGLSPRTFYIILAIVCALIIGGGIGGGVGAGLAKKNTDAAAASSAPKETAATNSALAGGISAATTTTTSATQSSTTNSASSSQTDAPSSTSSGIPRTTLTTSAGRTLIRDCPDSNDTVKEGTWDERGGLFYRKRCGVDFYHVPRPGDPTEHSVNMYVQSLDTCIDLCTQHNIDKKVSIMAGRIEPCNAVCWVNSLQSDWPGQCFGMMSRNVSSATEGPRGDFNFTATAECDSAAWINQYDIEGWAVPE